MKDSLRDLLETENHQLHKLNEIVLRSIEEEKLISERLYEFEDRNPPLKSRIADIVASFGGSWTFIFFFLGIMAIWMIANVYFLTRPFDPYPFILLNLFLSTIAAIQAPIIMISQNRKEEKDRKRAVNDYMVNLKSEIEIRNLHRKLDLLIAEQMQTMFEIQKAQMEIMEDIKEGIKDKNTSNSL
jgi:uncharacterized membrane protein